MPQRNIMFAHDYWDEEDKTIITYPENLVKKELDLRLTKCSPHFFYNWNESESTYIFNPLAFSLIVLKNQGKCSDSPGDLQLKSELIDTSIIQRYDPISEKKLIHDTLNLDLRNAEAILNYCDQYGLLSCDRYENMSHSDISHANANPDSFILADTLRLDKFCNFITEFKLSFEIYYNAIKKPNRKTLIKSLSSYNFVEFCYVNSDKQLTLIENKKSKADYDDTVSRLEKDNNKNLIFDFFKDILLETVNSRLAKVKTVLNKDSSGRVFKVNRFYTLQDYLYTWLGSAMANEIKLHRCKECEAIFQIISNKGNPQFCPSDIPGKHSLCENRYNQKIKTRRKKTIELYKDELCSVEEIYTALHQYFKDDTDKYMDMNLVSTWISDY